MDERGNWRDGRVSFINATQGGFSVDSRAAERLCDRFLRWR
jgi:hypothetical protein